MIRPRLETFRNSSYIWNMVNSLFERNQSLNRMWISITLSLSWLLEYPGLQIQEWHGEIVISHVMKSGMQIRICNYHAEALSSSISFKMSGTVFSFESNWELQLWILGVIASLPWCRHGQVKFCFFQLEEKKVKHTCLKCLRLLQKLIVSSLLFYLFMWNITSEEIMLLHSTR